MSITFEKYHGAGNDFILIDDRENRFDTENLELVKLMCHRRFGIGSDGLMLIRTHDDTDFEMIFFNPDGSRSLCGNGSRCAVDFARKLGMASVEGKFLTTDGVHQYRFTGDRVGISMSDVPPAKEMLGGVFFDTGSPHLVIFVEDVQIVDVFTRGRELRHREEFARMGGANVNFVSKRPDGGYDMRTYERGVEAETLSCGTGATAAALAVSTKYGVKDSVELSAPGGRLQVEFGKSPDGFSGIWLLGPTKYVFSGVFHVDR